MEVAERFWADIPRVLFGALAFAACAFSAADDVATAERAPEVFAAGNFQAANAMPHGDVRAGRPVLPLPRATAASPGLQIVKVVRRVTHPRGTAVASFGGRNALAAPQAGVSLRVPQSAWLANAADVTRLCRLLL